jgi:hypothetical protein
LFQRAIGYEADAIKIFQHEGKEVIVPYRERIAGDVTAAIFWLKNRKPEVWRDRKEVDQRTTITAGSVSPLAAIIAQIVGGDEEGPAPGSLPH